MLRPSRLAPVLLAAALASCEAGEPSGDGLPELREGFTYLKRVRGVIRNASMEGFSVAPVGLAVWNDRVGAVVLVGQFFQSFTIAPRYDYSSGSYVDGLGGSTSTNTWFTLHLSDDAGRTWRELALTPARDAPTGWTSGLVLVDDRVFTTVQTEEGRLVVEVDPDTGVYRLLDITNSDGLRFRPHWAFARAFGSVVVSVERVEDGGSFYAWRGDLRTGEVTNHQLDFPECVPWRELPGYTRGAAIPTAADTVQGLCTQRDNRVCAFSWRLTETSMVVEGCTSREDFDRPTALAHDGVVPTFAPHQVVPTPAGLHVVGTAVYGGGDGYTHAVALSFRDDGGPPDVIDFGRGHATGVGHGGLSNPRGGFTLISPDCGERLTLGATGACIGEGGPGGGFDEPTFVGWDWTADAFGAVRLSPSACADPDQCLRVPHEVWHVGAGRYLATWNLGMGGLEGQVERGLAIGFVYAPWYEPEPPPPDATEATPLEMHCWAELECDPTSRLQVNETLVERVRSCIERWRPTQGAPDTLWETFIGTALDDCEGLRAADPVGFVDPAACTAGCDPSGEVACNWMRSCEQANGGTCSVTDGVGGCFADACPDGATGESHCDAAGRWVDCLSGMVDDCASRGLTCLERSGCMAPDARCAEPGSPRCDGDVFVSCSGDGIAQRIDCARTGQRCESGDWGAACAPPTASIDPPRCEGERLVASGRVVDCAALGMRCFASAESWVGLCDPSR